MRPRSAVDPRLWARRTYSDSEQRGSLSARPVDETADSIQQYQRMLLIERQRRIQEMEEDRRTRSRDGERR